MKVSEEETKEIFDKLKSKKGNNVINSKFTLKINFCN